MKHAGRAGAEGLRLIFWTFMVLAVILGGGWVAAAAGWLVLAVPVAGLWLIFALFALNFFRDPDPQVPADVRAIVAPAHGTVDVIEESRELEVMEGACRRVSIFLSVFDVHVQNAPVSGRVTFFKHCPGQFLNAMRSDCGLHNENVLLGIESAEGLRVAVRLIAGLLARRIVPWVQLGETVERGERLSLIRFGSRVDLYFPLTAQIEVKLGDKVRGGETVVARRT